MEEVPAEDQLQFLANLQRLLDEGAFVASYKYALLHALADICVQEGSDSGSTFRVETNSIAEHFIAYYWRQSRPYPKTKTVLRQNTGKPAVVVTLLQKQAELGFTLTELKRRQTTYRRLRVRVRTNVEKMPLWKLQRLGNTTLDFLYKQSKTKHSIELRPGVMYCLRKFYPLITDVVRGAWIAYVRRNNAIELGDPTDLDQFLFGSERAALALFVPILRDAQAAKCLYCSREVPSKNAHVDHFIPWSRYPVDLGHNFVLAHKGCNAAKAQHLAATNHLQTWLVRNREAGSFLAEKFNRRHIAHDLSGSMSVVTWAYDQTARSDGLTWVRGKQFTVLPQNWRESVGW